MGKKYEGKKAEFNYKKTETEEEEEEIMKYRAGSNMGSMNGNYDDNADEEPEYSDIGEEDMTDNIEVDDEILYEEDNKHYQGEEESTFDIKVKQNFGKNTLADINNLLKEDKVKTTDKCNHQIITNKNS